MLAIRRVTQDNQGKRTAGIDGIKNVGPQKRLALVATLGQPEAIKARPVRRVMIPKPGKEGQFRPLGIPMCRSHCTSMQGAWGLCGGWGGVLLPVFSLVLVFGAK